MNFQDVLGSRGFGSSEANASYAVRIFSTVVWISATFLITKSTSGLLFSLSTQLFLLKSEGIKMTA